MATLIQVRRDTLANWTSNNPVLANGEIGFVTDNNRIKIGNGSSTFTSLSYVEADAYLDSVILGTDTTGAYVTTITSGSGISVSGVGSESSSAVITNTGVTSLAGTANEVDVSASAGAVTVSLPSTINADTTGNAASATALQTSRNITLAGDLSGSASFNGTSDVTITASVVADSVALGTDTTGDYVQSVSASGAGLSISGTGEGAAVTVQNTGVTSLAGTVNQVSVSASNGGVTVSLPSSVTFPGVVTLNANPGQPLEAATKQYVDAIAEGLHIHASVQAATSASVNLSSPPATIDGVTLTNNMRVLVKNQSTTSENGVYTYNSASGILVRADDFNSSAEIHGGDFVFVTGGSLYDNTGWVQTEIVTTLNTDPIIFQQFSGAGTYSAGTGLLLDGTQFSNTGVLSLTGTSDEVTVSASAGNITVSLPSTVNANTTGNAATATALETARAISLSGDLSGSASFNGTSNISITADIVANSVALGTDTTGDYVQSVSASGAGLSISGTGEGAAVTVQNTGVTSLAGTANEVNVSASAGAVTVSLPNTAVSAASYGSASAVGTFTVDSKGRLTAASNTNIAIAQSAVTNLTSDLALKASISYVDAKSYTLDSLSDVSASAPANNDLLVYESGLTTTTWTLQTSNFDPYSNIWNASYGNDLWVAVGDSGQLRTSTDTVSWVTQVSNFENAGNARIRSVAYNNGLWIAGGYTNELRTSTNAITWITQNPKVGNRPIFEITYGNGIWVGLASSWSITSTDTISWTTASLTTDYWALAYGQGIWAVAGGYGTLRTSTNGINWTTRTSNFGDTTILGISYGNGLWVAAGNSGQMRTSTNAVTWITRNSNFGTTSIQDIVYGAGVWIAVGYNGQVRSSTDTVTWTTQTSGFGTSKIYSVSYGNSKWVATGGYGKISTLPFTQQWKSISSISQSSITNLVSDLALKAPLASPTFTGTVTVPTPVNSTDAATKGYVDTMSYTLDSLSNVTASTAVNNNLLYYDNGLSNSLWATQNSNFASTTVRTVSYGNNIWVAGGDSGQVRTSTNYVTWTTRNANFGSTRVRTIAYGNGVFVAVGDNAEMRSSTDAISWTTRTSNFGTSIIYDVAYGAGIWIATGYGGSLRTSADLATWTTRTSNIAGSNYTGSIWSVAYGNGVWAIGAYAGQIRSSTDGITWVTRTSNFSSTDSIRGIAYGNGVWSAVGNNSLRTSTDLITWTTRTSPVADVGGLQMNRIVYGNGSWVLVADYGASRISTNGISWSWNGFGTPPFGSIFGPTNGSFVNGLAYGNSVFVAGGEQGNIASIPLSTEWRATSSITASSANFTGTVTVPTPVNSTDAATKGYVDTSVINTQSASYTLVLADAGEIIEMNVATANTLTIPLNSTVEFPIGTLITILQYGAGQTTITPTGGVTVRSSGAKLKLTGQYSGATLYKRGTDEWVVMGDLSA